MSEVICAGKTCTKCRALQPLSAYSPSQLGKNGLRSMCKSCDRDRYRSYRQRNPEVVARQHSEYSARRRRDQGRYETLIEYFAGRPAWSRTIAFALLRDHRCSWWERVSVPIAEFLPLNIATPDI